MSTLTTHWIETQEERRSRYMRLAIAAAVTAAKVPLPILRAEYLRLAQHFRARAEKTASEE